MKPALEEYIQGVYREPYSQLGNNCLHKSLKILRKARELGEPADLVACLSVVRLNSFHRFPLIDPHFYVRIEGRRVDVSLDPKKEQVFCPNSEKIIILPINLSSLSRHIHAFAMRIPFLQG